FNTHEDPIHTVYINTYFYNIIHSQLLPWVTEHCEKDVMPLLKNVPQFKNPYLFSAVFGHSYLRVGWSSPKKLADHNEQLIQTIRACVNKTPKAQHLTLAQMTEELDLDLDQLEKNIIEFNGGSPLHPDLNFFDSLLATVHNGIDYRANLEILMQIPAVRTYTAEDRADEIAVTIVKSLGLPLEPYYKSEIDEGSANDEEVAACKSMIQQNIEPPFGPLIDDHHSGCWRYWHRKNFAERFVKFPGLN
ncbi:MAG: hypothetical protein KDD40_07600, partial [Bdellovibrionales bacterium]|nr:hypothetical protein [Bdellovibrionales bacterium]